MVTSTTRVIVPMPALVREHAQAAKATVSSSAAINAKRVLRVRLFILDSLSWKSWRQSACLTDSPYGNHAASASVSAGYPELSVRPPGDVLQSGYLHGSMSWQYAYGSAHQTPRRRSAPTHPGRGANPLRRR